MGNRKAVEAATPMQQLNLWRGQLLTRRQTLLRLAGGTLAALLPLRLIAEPGEAESWRIIDAVQQRLLPSEPDAPGAREINALAYLQWVAGDSKLDADDRAFLLRGAGWLQDLCVQQTQKGFVDLDGERQEQMLQAVSLSEAGENWINSLLNYLLEALLTDPIYGGNPNAIGWNWLGHRPGFPRPNAQTRYQAGT